MATDALLQLQAQTTRTATGSGPAVNLPGGTPRRGLKARVIYWGAANATGANTLNFAVDTSADGVTWNAGDFTAHENDVALGTAAQGGEIFIPFETSLPWVRVTANITGAGTGPSVTYVADVSLSRP
jgi:hypothetical protein